MIVIYDCNDSGGHYYKTIDDIGYDRKLWL
jgi:hypothetical protein